MWANWFEEHKSQLKASSLSRTRRVPAPRLRQELFKMTFAQLQISLTSPKSVSPGIIHTHTQSAAHIPPHGSPQAEPCPVLTHLHLWKLFVPILQNLLRFLSLSCLSSPPLQSLLPALCAGSDHWSLVTCLCVYDRFPRSCQVPEGEAQVRGWARPGAGVTEAASLHQPTPTAGSCRGAAAITPPLGLAPRSHEAAMRTWSREVG